MRQLATGIAAAVLTVLVACGGARPAEPPVANVAPSASSELSTVSVGEGALRGSSREVSRSADGGVVELAGDRNHALEAAEQQMSSNCGAKRFTIIQDGEEAIDGSAGEAIAVAWRTHYQCTR